MRLIRKEFAAVPERFDGAAPWCPMSGRRAPEMAAGAFRKFVMDAIDLRSADVLADARVHLNENQSAVVVQDMELGTAHLAATMQLKLAHWEKPPWKLCGLAHHDPITASRVARELIDMNVGSLPRVGQHALTLDFLFADGKHQSIVERLAQQQPVSTDERQVLATFKFIDVNEQSIELEHADLKLAVGTRTVSLAYGSLKLRFNEVERILGDAKLKEQLTQCFFELRSPKNLAKEFRLNGHPQVQEALMNRCLSHQLRRILADVVYRGDIEAQYASMRDANRANKEKYRRNMADLEASPADRGPVTLENIKARLFRSWWQKDLTAKAHLLPLMVFSLPAHASSLKALDVFTRMPKYSRRSALLSADAAPLLEDDCDVTSMIRPASKPGLDVPMDAVDDPQVLFKVTHRRPAAFHLLKVAPGFGGVVPQDVILVTCHQALEERDDKAVVSMVPLRSGLGMPNHALTDLDTPVSLQIRTWARSGGSHSPLLYYFRSLPSLDQTARQAVTACVKHSAFEGTDRYLEVGPADHELLSALEALRGSGHAKASPQRAGSRCSCWQISSMGKADLDCGVALHASGFASDAPSGLLQTPPDELSDYHLVLRLEADGWTLEPWPRRGSPPAFVRESPRNWFSKGLLPPRLYMVALLEHDTILAAGVEEIAHGKPAKYYLECLRRAGLRQAVANRNTDLEADDGLNLDRQGGEDLSDCLADPAPDDALDLVKELEIVLDAEDEHEELPGTQEAGGNLQASSPLAAVSAVMPSARREETAALGEIPQPGDAHGKRDSEPQAAKTRPRHMRTPF